MQPLNIVLLQSDPGTAQSLLAPLCSSFHSVRTVPSLTDVKRYVAEHLAEIVILDMEIVALSEIAGLAHQFPGTCIICNHRLADDQMWSAALSAGAADCCPSHDTKSILTTVLQNADLARRMAA
jgi:hypothetical protein